MEKIFCSMQIKRLILEPLGRPLCMLGSVVTRETPAEVSRKIHDVLRAVLCSTVMSQQSDSSRLNTQP